MEVHSSVNLDVGRRLWNLLRIAFFMVRKGLTSKRKLIMDINMKMKRGRLLGRTLGNLMFHHHHGHHHRRGHSKDVMHGFGLHYEFSCSNSPNPVFFHMAKRKHHFFASIPHFPCLNPGDDCDEPNEPKAVIMLPKLEFSPRSSIDSGVDGSDMAVREKLSPLPSPLSIRVSNFSVDEVNENESWRPHVDAEAEEFIRMFYEQLRQQNRTALLQYQEMQYQEMLARGTG
ncbi:hypothetical protein AAC387_Pa08g2207 [Persea americana]